MKKPLYLKNVVTLILDSSKCTGCGMCVIVCPHAVFEINEKKTKISEKDACMECGACAKNCPVQAISVRSGVGCATAIIEGSVRKNKSKNGSCCCDTGRPCC